MENFPTYRIVVAMSIGPCWVQASRNHSRATKKTCFVKKKCVVHVTQVLKKKTKKTIVDNWQPESLYVTAISH